jgi:hypothetical protein
VDFLAIPKWSKISALNCSAEKPDLNPASLPLAFLNHERHRQPAHLRGP